MFNQEPTTNSRQQTKYKFKQNTTATKPPLTETTTNHNIVVLIAFVPELITIK